MPLTDEQRATIDRARELLKPITPGEWAWESEYTEDVYKDVVNEDRIPRGLTQRDRAYLRLSEISDRGVMGPVIRPGYDGDIYVRRADAAFVAAAPELTRALLTIIDTLTAELEDYRTRMREALDALHDNISLDHEDKYGQDYYLLFQDGESALRRLLEVDDAD